MQTNLAVREGSVYTVSSFGVEIVVWPLSLLALVPVVDVDETQTQLPLLR